MEVEGQRRLLPACKTPAQDGAEVRTETERIDRHRKTLFALYLTDHPQDIEVAERGAPNELLEMAARYEAPRDWGFMESLRDNRDADRNPYIHFNADTCISCARCTRYCEEVEGVSAITLAGRGAETTIATVDGLSLMDTSCELCGGCVDGLPHGRHGGEDAPDARGQARARADEGAQHVQLLAASGCQLDLNVDPDANDGRGQVVKVTSPPAGTTTNDGNLCVKGRFAYDFIHHEERITSPLVRDDDGRAGADQLGERALAWRPRASTASAREHGRRRAGLRQLVALHDGGELPRAEAIAGGVQDEQHPSVRGDMTRSDGGRSGHHLRRGRDDELDRGDP